MGKSDGRAGADGLHRQGINQQGGKHRDAGLAAGERFAAGGAGRRDAVRLALPGRNLDFPGKRVYRVQKFLVVTQRVLAAVAEGHLHPQAPGGDAQFGFFAQKYLGLAREPYFGPRTDEKQPPLKTGPQRWLFAFDISPVASGCHVGGQTRRHDAGFAGRLPPGSDPNQRHPNDGLRRDFALGRIAQEDFPSGARLPRCELGN